MIFILEYFEFENCLYVISKKNKIPEFDMSPSYGLFFKMKRIGKDGKIIGVYKIRTMHPYSEYCQELIQLQSFSGSSARIPETIPFPLQVCRKIILFGWINVRARNYTYIFFIEIFISRFDPIFFWISVRIYKSYIL